MSKGTKIALVVLAVLSLVCFAGVWSMLDNVRVAVGEQERQAKSAGNEILALYAGSWEYGSIELRTAPEFENKAATSEFATRAVFLRQRLGTLVSGEMEVTATDFGDDLKSPKLTAWLKCRATFEKGKGNVTMTLTREPRNSWMLADFDVTPVP